MIQSLKQQIIGDRKRKYELLMHKRDEFLKENTSQRREKLEKEDSEK